MNQYFKKIYFYIIKSFLIKLFWVILAISLLIFIINLFDIIDKVGSDNDSALNLAMQMSALHIPGMLEDISIFLIMLGSMITIFGFSTKSEITIMRASGLSIWQILFPLIVTAFLLGIFLIIFFGPLTIAANKKFSVMEQKFINKEVNDVLSPPGGIWIRQENILNKNEEIIIRAGKVYKDNLELSEVSLWFFSSENEFYKKINAKKMFLMDGYWSLTDAVINDEINLNKNLKNLNIPTNLKPEFIIQKIINNFENVKLFSIFELPKLITNLEESGFSSRKFKIYYYSLLTKPILFAAMILIAAFFAINNIRNKNNIIYMAIGIMLGLLLYIGLAIIEAFGSSGIIPPFAATWITTLVLFTTAILLIFRKENI